MANVIYHTQDSVRPLYRGTQLVWYILGLFEALLGFRFILRLIAANPAAGFTDFIYTATRPLVAPFDAVVRNARVSGSVFDWNTVIAMAVYWLIAWAIVRLFFINRPVSEGEARYEIKKENNRA